MTGARGRKLAVSVAVRHPASGQVEVLEAGSTVPSWAKDLVGDHAFGSSEDKADAEAEAKAKG